MSGNGPPTGIRRSTKPMRRRRAAFPKIRAVASKTRATILAIRRAGFRARCSRAARISAHPTIAGATVRPRVTRSRSTPRRAMSASGASREQEDHVMSNNKIPENLESNMRPVDGGLKRRDLLLSGSSLVAASALSAVGLTSPAQAQQAPTAPAAAGRRPNIVVIMGDDIGWFNIGAYHQGIMSGKTPNLDKLASEGMRFTDYYAEASCTAGRANFITGEIPLRTGLTTVGQAGADVGMPDQAVTLATVLKSLGYETAQFGKNHLGDLNKYLPTVHGFDQYFGYLYHLDALSDPYWFDYPQ